MSNEKSGGASANTRDYWHNGLYDYDAAVRADLYDWLKERIGYEGWNADEAEDERESLRDDASVADEVTGNGSGSYFFNEWESAEAVCHNLDMLGEAVDELGVDDATFREKMSGEWADVTIRCHVLGRVFDDVLDEVLDEMRAEEEDAEEEDDEDGKEG